MIHPVSTHKRLFPVLTLVNYASLRLQAQNVTPITLGWITAGNAGEPKPAKPVRNGLLSIPTLTIVPLKIFPTLVSGIIIIVEILMPRRVDLGVTLRTRRLDGSIVMSVVRVHHAVSVSYVGVVGALRNFPQGMMVFTASRVTFLPITFP